jgi:hypothetical protein
MALHSDLASIAFEPDSKGKMVPVQLKADDHVVIRRPDQVLWADHLIVDLGHGEKPVITAINDADQTTPSTQDKVKDPVDALDTMLAWEEKEKPVPTVVPVDGVTDVTVAATTDPAKANGNAKDSSKLYLKNITVQGDVRARMLNDDQPVFAFADRITGDEQQIELFGNDNRPSQVMLDAGILAGDHLVLTLNDQNLHVIGKGTLSFLSHPIDEKTGQAIQDNGLTKPKGELNAETISAINVDGKPEAKITTASPATPANITNNQSDTDLQIVPQLPSLEPAKVHVSWQDNMHYNHQIRQAQFLGSVLLTAQRTQGATTVKGDDITVLFSKFVDHPTASSAYETPNLPSVNDDGLIETKSLKGGRQIRMVNIKGHAEFLEESWAPAPVAITGSVTDQSTTNAQKSTEDKAQPARGPLLTRLRLAGETMVFDAVPETITIPGPGTLLHEDHRPKSSASNKEDVQFTGRGQTLFRWKDQFLLDIAHNDMIMKDYVQMLHIPADSANGIQLDCRTFLADMESTGGLGTWLSGDAPTPDLKVVQASRDVRITADNRQITTDRATYINNVRKVKLQADENNLTRITTQAGTSVGVELIIWELDTNRFYIAKPGLINEVAPRRR